VILPAFIHFSRRSRPCSFWEYLGQLQRPKRRGHGFREVAGGELRKEGVLWPKLREVGSYVEETPGFVSCSRSYDLSHVGEWLPGEDVVFDGDGGYDGEI